MMSNRLSLHYQRLAAYSGLAFVVLYAVFWCGFGHNLPPAAAPNLSAADVTAFYAQNRWSVLFGNTMAALVGILWAPWTAQLTVAMKRIEGEGAVLAYMNLIGGTIGTWVLMFAPAVWVVAAYRPDMPPDIVRAINDFGFIVFNITYAGATLQAIVAGLAGLADTRDKKLFPTWVSWWAIITGLSFLPISALPFFTSGPFAWNGLVTFWIAFGTFFIWCVSMGHYMAKEATVRLNNMAGVAVAREAGGRVKQA